MKFLPTEAQKIKYLSDLLNSDQILKTQVAFDIHAKKTQIICQEMLLTDIKSAIDKNENPNDKLEILKQNMITLRAELADLYEKHLANRAGKIRPNFRLQHCIRKLAEQFDGKIDFEPKVINKNGLDEEWEKPYYLACSYAIEIVCHYGYRVINIKLVIIKNGFQILVEGQEMEKIKIDTTLLEDRLNKLKGILIWKRGKVESSTDWKSLIAFNFSEISN